MHDKILITRSVKSRMIGDVKDHTYMPNDILKKSQIMMIGANALASLAIPRGCIRNRRTKMAQLTPMIVGLPMFSLTTFKPKHIVHIVYRSVDKGLDIP